MATGGMKIGLSLNLSQRLVMTPQLQQAIKLLLLSRLELNQVIDLEMLENPLLEEGVADAGVETPEVQAEEASLQSTEGLDERREAPEGAESFDLKWEDYYLDEDFSEGREHSSVSSEELPSYEQTLARPVSLVDHLLWQLGLSDITEIEREVGALIIGNIEDDGYLRTPTEEIATLSGRSIERVETVLQVIQQFDPPGVGARDLRECLLIQVGQLGLADSLVADVVKNHIELLEQRAYQKIASHCNVSVAEVLRACKIIEHLEPKPGRPFSSQENMVITPDVIVVKSEEGYRVALNDDGLPKLKISPYYRGLLRSKETVAETTKVYLEGKLRSALWLVHSIEQRNRTILRVAESIVKFQYEFMDKGIQSLKPLILRQVAEDISMHESTVSRVTTRKYILTPQGIHEMKFFFNNGLKTSDDDLSAVVVRERIKKMVAREDPRHPLKDQDIVEQLKKDRIEIARRTVTKYRVTLKIPSSKRRRSTSNGVEEV